MSTWRVDDACECLLWLSSLSADSVDLIFASPPYEDQRTYGIKFSLKGEAWVSWMVNVVQASLRVCKGLVAFVVEGKTSRFRWSATPALLMADLHLISLTSSPAHSKNLRRLVEAAHAACFLYCQQPNRGL